MQRIVLFLVILTACAHSKNKPKTTIHFKHSVITKDNIPYKSECKFCFEFINTGTEPLTIEQVGLSCSCLKSDWPENKVMPGDTALIIIYKDTGRIGSFKDQIKVHFNGKDSPAKLLITGNIRYN